MEEQLQSLAEWIRDAPDESVVVATGAGISVSAGIADYRTPDIGLFFRVGKYKMRKPENIFLVSEVALSGRPLSHIMPHMLHSQFTPTLTHQFIKLLNDNHKLMLTLTQNIDCLEKATGLPESKIIQAHGREDCLVCKNGVHSHIPVYDITVCLEASMDGAVPVCPECGSLLRTPVIFYGESLDKGFIKELEKLSRASIVIIAGTCMKVSPFNLILSFAPDAKHVLVNLESFPPPYISLSGPFPCSTRTTEDSAEHKDWDAKLIGKSDDVLLKLADKLGWRSQLEQMIEQQVKGKQFDFKTYFKEKREKVAEEDKLSRKLVFVPAPCSLIPPTAILVNEPKTAQYGALLWMRESQQIRVCEILGGKFSEDTNSEIVIGPFDNEAIIKSITKQFEDATIFPEQCKGLDGDENHFFLIVRSLKYIIDPEMEKKRNGIEPLWSYKPIGAHWAMYADGILMLDPTKPDETLGGDLTTPFSDAWWNINLAIDSLILKKSPYLQIFLGETKESLQARLCRIMGEDLDEMPPIKLALFPPHVEEFITSLVARASSLNSSGSNKSELIALLSCKPCGPISLSYSQLLCPKHNPCFYRSVCAP